MAKLHSCHLGNKCTIVLLTFGDIQVNSFSSLAIGCWDW
jgi:hypothetical protein